MEPPHLRETPGGSFSAVSAAELAGGGDSLASEGFVRACVSWQMTFCSLSAQSRLDPKSGIKSKKD